MILWKQKLHWCETPIIRIITIGKASKSTEVNGRVNGYSKDKLSNAKSSPKGEHLGTHLFVLMHLTRTYCTTYTWKFNRIELHFTVCETCERTDGHAALWDTHKKKTSISSHQAPQPLSPSYCIAITMFREFSLCDVVLCPSILHSSWKRFVCYRQMDAGLKWF